MEEEYQLLRYNPEIEKIREKRRQEMRQLREAGWTLQKIADKFNMTRQRVFQILRGEEK